MEDSIDRSKCETAVSWGINEFVFEDACVLGTDYSDVDAGESLNSEACDRYTFDESSYRFDSLVISNERGGLDIMSSDTDTGLKLVLLRILGQACAGVLLDLSWIWLFEDGAATFKLNAVLVDNKLFRVGTSWNNDTVTGGGPVDGMLDTLSRLDVNGATIAVVVLVLRSGWVRFVDIWKGTLSTSCCGPLSVRLLHSGCTR